MQTNLQTLNDAGTRTEQLAHAMFELYAEHGEATETLLLREGYSRYELQTMGEAARAIAEKRRIRSEEGFSRTDEEWTDIAAAQACDLVDEQAIFAQLRNFGIPTIVLGRIWPELMRKLASSLAGRPLPVGA